MHSIGYIAGNVPSSWAPTKDHVVQVTDIDSRRRPLSLAVWRRYGAATAVPIFRKRWWGASRLEVVCVVRPVDPRF